MNDNNFLWFLIYLVISVLVVYLLGCFIAWDTNPSNWWLIKTIAGRLLLVILFIGIISGAIKTAYGDI